MNIKTAAAAIGVAAFLSAPAFVAAAEVQSTPINIESVQLYGGSYVDNNEDYNVLPASMDINFTNELDTPAVKLVFVIENNGTVVQRLADAGTFTKGATIRHRFGINLSSGDPFVAVAEATFADGTVWHNPDVPAAFEPAKNVGVEARF